MQYLSSLFGRAAKKILRLMKNESGVTAIEYALIASLIAVAGVTAMGTIGTSLTTTFSKVASSL